MVVWRSLGSNVLLLKTIMLNNEWHSFDTVWLGCTYFPLDGGAMGLWILRNNSLTDFKVCSNESLIQSWWSYHQLMMDIWTFYCSLSRLFWFHLLISVNECSLDLNIFCWDFIWLKLNTLLTCSAKYNKLKYWIFVNIMLI